MNHVHGGISIRMHLVLRPSPAGLVANVLQSADVARLLAAEPGARAYSLDCTLLDLLESHRLRWTPLEPMETIEGNRPGANASSSSQERRQGHSAA